MKYLSKFCCTFVLLCLSFVVNAGCPPDTICVDVVGTRTYSGGPTPAPSGMTTGTLNGGGNEVAAKTAGAAIAKEQCLTGVAAKFGGECGAKTAQIYDDALTKCNSISIGAAGLVGFATVGALLLSGPPGWLVGGLLTIGFVGGGAGATYGQTACRDTAVSNNNYNKETACPVYVRNAQVAMCPQ